MQREVRKLLFDIKQAAELISQFTAGKTFEDYEQDRMMQSAVERQFGIIGEALHNVLDRDRSLDSRISMSGRIIAFRNRLIHGYAAVSATIVWGVIETNLSVLTSEVEVLLQE